MTSAGFVPPQGMKPQLATLPHRDKMFSQVLFQSHAFTAFDERWAPTA